MKIDSQNYVIVVDGGGTKTVAVLADLKGRTLTQAKAGPSNPTKIDTKTAIDNLVSVIEKVVRNYQKNKIALVYIALAGCLETDKKRKQRIKNSLLKQTKLSWISAEKLLVERDQLAAFRSGTDEKNGVLLIAGTGSIATGWYKGKEVVAGGWGHFLGDTGGGFWIGQKALRAICRFIDGLSQKTLLTELVFKKLKIKNKGDLVRKIYQPEVVKIIASIAPLIDIAARRGDKVAKKILLEAAEKSIITAKQVIKELNLRNKKFPLVLTGSVFESEIILNKVKKDIKKIAPGVKFIRPKEKTITGAVKLAIKKI